MGWISIRPLPVLIRASLTSWERRLRSLAGKAYLVAFLANLVHDLLFYDAELWVFTAIYTAFGMLAVGSFLLAPPRAALVEVCACVTRMMTVRSWQ